MTLNNEPIKTDHMAERFAEFFVNKVGDIVRDTVVSPRVYNGTQKIHADSSMFMTRDMILECVDGLKLKNTEGYFSLNKIYKNLFSFMLKNALLLLNQTNSWTEQTTLKIRPTSRPSKT